jgi:hypothetical protein
MTARDLRRIIQALEIAEYRIRVNDWAEGDSNESDDGAAVRAYWRTVTRIERALRIARNELGLRIVRRKKRPTNKDSR